MKTIEQLFKENGEKFGFKVKRGDWEDGVFETVFAKATNGEFITEDDNGVPDVWGGSDEYWELYEEPKPVETLYEWYVQTTNGGFFKTAICDEKTVRSHYPHIKHLTPNEAFQMNEQGKLVQVPMPKEGEL